MSDHRHQFDWQNAKAVGAFTRVTCRLCGKEFKFAYPKKPKRQKAT